MVWKELRSFGRKHLWRYLGIPVIEPNHLGSKEEDWIYRASLEELATLRVKLQIDLNYLRARDQYLGAVVKAAPYALISSIVAVGWTILTEDMSATIPISAIASLVILLAVACNRLADETERQIGLDELSSKYVNDRVAIRVDEVKGKLKNARSTAPDVFRGYFAVGFDRQSLDVYRGQASTMLPDSESHLFMNMNHVHKNSMEMAIRLREKAEEFIDAIEDWVKEVAKRAGSNPGDAVASYEEENEIAETSRVLIWCLNENLLEVGQIRAHIEEAKGNRAMEERLSKALLQPIRELLDDNDLRTKAIAIEKLRGEGLKLWEDFSREVLVLYG